MTAETFTRGWVRTYTRGLPDGTRAARFDEVASDLHEHRSAGGNGAAIVGRTLRGVAADISWRREERRAMESGTSTGLRALWATATQAWFAPFAVLLALFNVLFAIRVVVEPDSKLPGQVIGPVIILSLTAGLLIGLRLRWRAGRAPTAVEPARVGRRVGLGIVAVIAIAAIVLGAMVSLAVFAAGVVLLAGIAVAARRGPRASRRRSRGAGDVVVADVLIVAGALPALGVWWLVVPAVLALMVIGGVIGTGPGTRRRAAATL